MPQPPELPLSVAPSRPTVGELCVIRLGDRSVSYLLRRSRRRTIGLLIDQRGLIVGAPPRAGLDAIEAVIRHHGHWVLAKLEDWRNRPRSEPVAVADGLRLPFLGGEIRVRLALGANRVVWNAAELTLCLKPGADPRAVLERAWRERAREHFAARLTHYTAQLGVEAPPLSLSAARTRWGSCSRRSGIRLNWRLLHFPPVVIDYVVAHEVAHLVHMNHSARFWSVVESLYPDHAVARAELKRRAAELPHW